jgi:hypothetical protein
VLYDLQHQANKIIFRRGTMATAVLVVKQTGDSALEAAARGHTLTMDLPEAKPE